MALKAKLKKSDYEKLSDELKKEYKLEGEEYILDVEGGEDVGALKRANQRLKEELEDGAKTIKDQKKIIDTFEEKGHDVVKLTKAHDKEKEALAEKHKEELAKRDGYIAKHLKTSLATEISAKLNSKNPKVFVPHVEQRLSVDLTGDEPKIVILDSAGKPSDLTADKLYDEFVANKDFAGMILGTQASGGAGANRSAGGGAPANQNNNGQPPDLSRVSARDLVARIDAAKAAQQ